MEQKKTVRCNKKDHLPCFLARILHKHNCFHFDPHEFEQSCEGPICKKLGQAIHDCECVEVKKDDDG